MKKHIKVTMVIILSLFSFLIFPVSVKAVDTINVGFIDYKGFIEKDSSGAYSGYAVDYLNEISKYTQWEYHYVFDSWEKCLEKLKKGEIDILCSAQYTKERDQDFDFSKYPIGNEYTIVYTRLDEPIYFNDYQAMNHKTIGLLKNSYQNQSLKQYAMKNNFDYQKKYYSSEEEINQALMNHEVDMIAVGSLPIHSQVKVVAKFDPQPFYITVKEGNQVLLDKINDALTEIKKNAPYFEMSIYNKYYSDSAYSTQPLLTRQEIEYIQKLGVVQIGFNNDLLPYSYENINTNIVGILPDILEKISKKTNIKFEYVPVNSRKEMKSFLDEDYHIYCGALKNLDDISDDKYWISHSLLNVDQVVVTRNESVFDTFDDAIVALNFGFESIGKDFLKKYPHAHIQYYTTVEECLDAVHDKEADLTINNAYTMNYMIQKPEYVDDLTAHSIALEPYSLYLFTNKQIDNQLVSILNKAINSFNDAELDKIVYGYTIGYRYEYSFLDNVYMYRYFILFAGIVFTLVSIFIIILNKRHTQHLIDKKEADILRKKVEIDDLTGLYNYETFFDKIRQVLDSQQADFCMIYIDVNRFKIVNELYGMEIGNQLLVYIGEQLQKISQQYTNVISCHLSADKFFVFTPKEYMKELLEIDLLEDNNLEMGISIRYGVFDMSDYSMPINLMCDRAVLASQDVKNNYFRKVGIYDDQKRLEILHEQEIFDDIQQAILEHQLFIMIQPKYDIQNHLIVGGEALVRWEHPEKGFIPPNEFIPIIENNGYIIQLDYYVWDLACQFIQKMKTMGIDINISVNVSRLNFYRPHLVELFIDLVRKYKIEPKNLQLEITETVYCDDKEFIYSIIKELQRHGFTILMDDFGSGYSSLNMLKDAPVDIIKLDMDFLDSHNETNRSKAIVKAIIDLTHSLDLSVVVEGVETKQEVDFLNEIQAYIIQGYYFSRPLMEDDFITLYVNTNQNK